MHGRILSIVTFAITVCSMLFGHVATASARVEFEAIVGEPFGVGRVTIPLDAADAAALQTNALFLKERDGRALYPTFSEGVVRRLLGEIIGGSTSDVPSSVTAMFLFKGEAPLRLTVFTSRAQTITLTPKRESPRVFSRLLRNWWRQYNAAARQQMTAGDYPPLIETYLTTMLAQRLGLEPPLLSRIGQSSSNELKQTMELLLGVENLRNATLRDTMLGRGVSREVASRAVPADISWTLPAAAASRPKVDIEPIAMHVPDDCLYVRYGTFANYLWLSHLMDDYGGDMSRMVNLRGHDAGLNAKMQKQLALKQTTLGEIFGGQVIADVAMIGRDLFMREGAAFGMLFQAKNALLKNDFNKQRAAAQKEHALHGAKLETVKIAGRDVSFLSTPDNRLRSYYVIDGDFHLVSTSKRIVERFLEVSSGRGSFGASDEFHHARTVMPTNREDTIFVYMSSAFFRGLVSPQYQIELARRIQSVTDMELVQMARLAAKAEGQPGETVEELIAGGLLPRGFGRRADGSGPILTDDGAIDSRRGARGSFTPVPDVELRAVTPSEASRYASRAAFYQDNWEQMDPLMVGVKRFALDKQGKERLVIDASVSPFGAKKYGWIMSMLGPPTKARIAPAPGDVINVQMSVRGGLLLPSIPPHHLFAGVQDVAPPATDLQPTGFKKTLQILRTTPGYLGAWPKSGFLDLLPFGLAGQTDAHGFSRFPFGIWRRQFGHFSVLSFDQRMLADVTPHLRPVEAETPAQIRIHVHDLSKSKLTGWITGLNYQRAMQTSLGNVRMLHTLTQQLNVPPKESLETAQRLLDVRLLCSLLGEYQAVENPTGIATWQSTKLTEIPVRRVPEGYEAPILQWFRGLDANLTKTDGRMMVHAYVDMQRKKPESRIQLPSFDFFGSKKNDKTKPKPEEIKAPAKKPREF